MASSPDLKFLKALHKESLALEKRCGSKDHWASPYFSNVAVFRPEISRVFIGLNGKGDRFAKRLHDQQDTNTRVWSETYKSYNANLDDQWGNAHGSTPPGQAPLQVAIQKVFQAMYPGKGTFILRQTACFNLIPVSSQGASDPILRLIWRDGVNWGLKLLYYLTPKLIITNGNGPQSAYKAIAERYGLNEAIEPVPLENPTFQYKEAKVASGPFKNARVIGLPHLSRNRATKALIRAIEKRRPFP